ncbi:hypothetical protein ElyMa_001778300 [Elysia marginata]|uniref:Uncharacterized protein n=1 Tax=Elysia marginata TaxID=1093978 RepID=A0AAV4EDR2_9GAST|nr:hypothetical protein ElyMa_001778300 [Elysia marginata]
MMRRWNRMMMMIKTMMVMGEDDDEKEEEDDDDEDDDDGDDDEDDVDRNDYKKKAYRIVSCLEGLVVAAREIEGNIYTPAH